MINRSIGEIVTENFKTARVFGKYKIDFCCGGKKTLEEVISEKNLNAAEILMELELVQNSKGSEFEILDQMNLSELITYITDQHHAYIRNQGPVIAARLEKLVRVHGANHPELMEIQNLFSTHYGALTQHLMKEELILFPYIKAMAGNFADNAPKPSAMFGSVKNPIGMMEVEHVEVGRELEELRRLTHEFQCPPDGCTTYRTTYDELHAWETDIHTHVHLENNILHPKAMALEASWN